MDSFNNSSRICKIITMDIKNQFYFLNFLHVTNNNFCVKSRIYYESHIHTKNKPNFLLVLKPKPH